jgi:hypothetical protein
MNRLYGQYDYSLEKDLVHLYAKVAIGGTGAPTLSRGKGIASVVRNGAGDYTVTFQDKYRAFLHASVLFQDADGVSAAGGFLMGVKAEDVSGAKTLNVIFADVDTAAATEVDNGATLYFHFVLSRTSAI